jgi:predicted HTH domain antitoxin
LLALELYREDKVSLGRAAAELCHMPLAAFMDFASKHGVALLRYNFETWKKNASPRTVLKHDCRIRFVAAD